MCDILKGRLLKCKSALGGLKSVYFVNWSEWTDLIDPLVFTPSLPSGAPITAITAIAPKDAFKYDLHLGNDLTQNINSSEENGTTFYEQVLSLTLKGLSSDDNTELHSLITGRPVAIVEDNLGNFFVVGAVNGLSISGGTAVTGSAMGDLSGYTLVLTGREQFLANFYTGDIDAQFAVTAGV